MFVIYSFVPITYLFCYYIPMQWQPVSQSHYSKHTYESDSLAQTYTRKHSMINVRYRRRSSGRNGIHGIQEIGYTDTTAHKTVGGGVL